jgi:hypothetical protein
MNNPLHVCVQNAPDRPEYAIALRSLQPVLKNLPPVIVSIDGRSGVGKTTLGRFLAWRFNVSLLESDLFLIRNQGALSYRNEEVKAVIQSRLSGKRPIIVEGICALKLLKNNGFEPAFHVRVDCAGADGVSGLEQCWLDYLSLFNHVHVPHLVINLPILS